MYQRSDSIGEQWYYGGTWSISDAGVATVDGNGVVLGKTPGLATITYTVSSTCATKLSASYNITVNPVPVAGTVSDASICKGSSITFTSTVVPVAEAGAAAIQRSQRSMSQPG